MASGFEVIDILGVAVSIASLLFAIIRMKPKKKKTENDDKNEIS